MGRIFIGTSTLVLSVATLMWTAAPSGAGKGRAGGGHASGGHAAPAHVGSVHYASRPAPARVAPARVAPARVAPARTGTVRSEHYAGSTGSVGGYHTGGGHQTRYRDEYFNRFRPGYFPFMLSDGYQYYGYYDLPIGYQTEVSDGITYYFFDGVYYQAYIIDGRTVYVAVPN